MLIWGLTTRSGAGGSQKHGGTVKERVGDARALARYPKAVLIGRREGRTALGTDAGGNKMNDGVNGERDELRTKRFYHGTRQALRVGDVIEPSSSRGVDEAGTPTSFVCLTNDLDEAIWDAELAVGDGPGRVYSVADRPRRRCCSVDSAKASTPSIDVLLFPRAVAGNG